MSIQELLADLKLLQEEINLLLSEMKAYNKQHPEKQVPVLELKENINSILITQIPFIGRAIAKVRNEHFLDSDGNFSLSIEENAMLYAAYKLDKYYRNPKTRKGEHQGHL